MNHTTLAQIGERNSHVVSASRAPNGSISPGRPGTDHIHGQDGISPGYELLLFLLHKTPRTISVVPLLHAKPPLVLVLL